MKKVFVSGCYDLLHAGHVEFFKQAKALGDYLIVSFASDEVLMRYKKRRSALPEAHKKYVLESLSMVDEVVTSSNPEEYALDFKDNFLRIKPDILAVTEDDKFGEQKKALCAQVGAQYVVLPKTLSFEKVSTTEMRQHLTAPLEVPLRLDFAGGWLDVPKFSILGAYIVNCTITPKVSLSNWPYARNSGVGGSAAYAYLQGKDSLLSELGAGCGWQDPAIIKETGLCVWRSGEKPVLDFKINPDFLNGKLALYYTNIEHRTSNIASIKRDYKKLALASIKARKALLENNFDLFCEAVNDSLAHQLEEGMSPLPSFGEKAKKYAGSGHGGYAIYIFSTQEARDTFLKENSSKTMKVEPYIEL